MPRSFRLALALAGLLAGPAGADRRAFAPPDVPARYLPERAFDLEHLKLDLRFDWDHRAIEGTATNVLHPLRANLKTVTFHASGLDVRRVRLAGASADLAFRLDPSAETLAVDLDRAYAPAERLEIAIDYAAHPKRGLYFVGPDRGYPGKPKQIWSQGETDFNRGWFPSWDEPDDRATTELLATVPAAWTAIGNGKLLETLDRPDGWRTFHWRMDVPHSTYLTSVVAGELVRVADSWRGIPVEYDVPPGEEARARRSFGKTPDVLEFFSRATGRPYPYAKYAQATAVDFRWGGMENISATTQTIGTLHDEKDENDFPSTGLVAHEAAHQWFGDLITCRDWSEVWLNEGFASYFDALYQEHDRGADQLAIEIDDARDSYFREDGKEYRRPIVTRRFAGPDSMFDATTYDKGALVLHMLRGIAGDEAFFSGIRRYVERFAERTVTTADFEGAFEEATGLSLGSIFDGWVRGAGHPELDVRWEWLDAEKTARLHVTQTQEQTEETHLFAFPLEIAWAGARGLEVQRVGIAAKKEQDLLIPRPERPATIVVDPHGWLLADVHFDKPVAEWIAQLEAADHLAPKLEAVRALGEAGGAEAVAALAETLRKAPSYHLRGVAAEQLGEIGSDAALAPLVAALGEPDSRARAGIVAALAKFPERTELAGRLAGILASDPSDAVRAAAAKALGAFADSRDQAAPPLLSALDHPSHRERVRAAAIEALARLGEPRAWDRARKLAAYGAPAESRGAAFKAIAILARDGEVPRRKQQALRILEGFLNDPDYRARGGVFQALAELREAAALSDLERAAAHEEDFDQRRRAEAAARDLRQALAGGGDLRTRLGQLEEETAKLRREIDSLREHHEGGTP